MVITFVKGGFVPIFMLAGIVAVMAGQSFLGLILFASAFICHRS